jgi:hypothetical protein
MTNSWAEVYEAIYYGDEITIECKGKKYFIQGWDKNESHFLSVYVWEGDEDGDYTYEVESSTREERVKSFQQSKLFDGKTLKEVWDEAEWIENE